ncbi:MAG: CotH kinase family protein [Pseudomonadota bacterium]|nr:CotH kinase family protein [Pseudomonadota bacterium]
MPFFLYALVGCQALPALDGEPGTHEREPPPLPQTPEETEQQPDAPGAGFPYAEGQIFELSLALPPASVEALDRGGDYVPATLEFAGFEAVLGVRLKGSSTFDNLDGKPSLKLRFSEFVPEARFLGVERLTLNSMKYDPTMLREAAAYRLYAQMGVPAPRSAYAHLAINGEDYGVYSIVESLDENFLKRVFPGDDDGNLYDTVFVYADLTSLGLANFELAEGDPATAYTDLAALVHDLDGGDILGTLESRFDLESTLSFLAVDLLTANWDGYSRNTNNYLLYHATVSDRWSFVPWGQDTAFRGDGPLYGGIQSRITTACQAHPECRALLEQRIRDALAAWEGEDLHGWTERLADIVGPACAADPRKDGDCEPEDILDHLASRPDSVRGEIGP